MFVAAFLLSFASVAIAGESGGDAAATAPPASAAPSPDAGSSDAIRHAKRTECLRQAKAKKLLGADRTAYVKTCLAAPQGSQ
jgi:hypothetical protein